MYHIFLAKEHSFNRKPSVGSLAIKERQKVEQSMSVCDKIS